MGKVGQSPRRKIYNRLRWAGADIQTNFASVLHNIYVNDVMADIASPGHFNDPGAVEAFAANAGMPASPSRLVPARRWRADMLQVGNPGLSFDEQLTHFALWYAGKDGVGAGVGSSSYGFCRVGAAVAGRCVVSAPLLAGTDVVHATAPTLSILTAKELIAINQDLGKAGKIQGRHVFSSTNGTLEAFR